MTSLPNYDARNRTGLARLRDRYIRRAVALLESSAFNGAINDTRATWNQQHPQHRISVEIIPEDAHPLDSWLEQRMLWPASLLQVARDQVRRARDGTWTSEDDREVATLSWTTIVNALGLRFWPSKYFLNPYQKLGHPATGFVSACLLYHAGTITPEGVERLFPHLTVDIEALPYEPADPWDFEKALGGLAFYRSVVRELLQDDPQRLKALEIEAIRVSAKAARKKYPEGRWGPGADQWWWYVPVVPGMSASDLTDAAPRIAETISQVFGFTPINDLIIELADAGTPIPGIAELLGITESTVKRAKRGARSR